MKNNNYEPPERVESSKNIKLDGQPTQRESAAPMPVNRRTLRRVRLEQTSLDALKHHLMGPELFAEGSSSARCGTV
jgi:hypothetical protein